MFWRRVERATIRIDPCDPSPEFLRDCFAEVFASLDERPRKLALDVYAECESRSEAAITIVNGEPVFMVDGRGVACANFRRRWLAEHPVPLVLKRRGPTRLLIVPASANRLRIQLRRAWSSLALT